MKNTEAPTTRKAQDVTEGDALANGGTVTRNYRRCGRQVISYTDRNGNHASMVKAPAAPVALAR
ncbi:MAG TPA: hypothetical protein VMW08_00525 [Acidimicrobiales bacterium]|nr:hypothetical protein [Acidimicrobiales bacterium]